MDLEPVSGIDGMPGDVRASYTHVFMTRETTAKEETGETLMDVEEAKFRIELWSLEQFGGNSTQ